jgi:hypothetical protein
MVALARRVRLAGPTGPDEQRTTFTYWLHLADGCYRSRRE